MKIKLVLLLAVLALGACSGGGSSGGADQTADATGTTPVTPPVADEESTFPVVQDGMIHGVNVQGAFRTRLHSDFTEQQVVQRVAHAITELGFNSIRIGGTSSYGGTFDASYKGYGWSKHLDNPLVQLVHSEDTYASEPWNFNVMALRTAAEANVSVWIDLSTLSDDEEIRLILELLEEYQVTLAGITRDNEPYIPKRFADYDAAYDTLDAPRYRDAWWPGMYIIDGEQPGDRAERQEATAEKIVQLREAGEGVELHVYYPAEAAPITPREWISDALASSASTFNTSDFMVGEWSGKNQETFSDTDIEEIIESFLQVFAENGTPSYYQTLASESDTRGLWNFISNEPIMQRGADLFMDYNTRVSP